MKRKRNLIKSLTHRALMICSESKLGHSLQQCLSIGNVPSVTKNKISVFNIAKPSSVPRSPVYLCLPWLGSTSERYAKLVSLADRKYYFSANTRVVFYTKPIHTSMRKNSLPP